MIRIKVDFGVLRDFVLPCESRISTSCFDSFLLRICIKIFDKYLQPTVKKLFHTTSYPDLFYAIIY